MNQEVNDYLENVSRLLNATLRGAINKKAKEENEQLILITLTDVFNKACNWSKTENIKDGKQ